MRGDGWGDGGSRQGDEAYVKGDSRAYVKGDSQAYAPQARAQGAHNEPLGRGSAKSHDSRLLAAS